MVITFIKSKKRQKYFVLLLIVVVLAIAFLIWNYFFAKPKLPALKPPSPPEIKINFEILKNPALDELQLFEKILPFQEEIGRKNPFLPY